MAVKFHSLETRLRMSESAKKYRKEHPEFATGNNHPFLGKKHSEETKALNRKAHTGLKASFETRQKMSLSHSGPKHWNYIDGRSKSDYPDIFTPALKEKIRARDNFQCQGKNCDMTEEEHLIVYGQSLHVHHIDYNKEDCSEANLISTCLQCNVRANYNRAYWQSFYANKMKGII